MHYYFFRNLLFFLLDFALLQKARESITESVKKKLLKVMAKNYELINFLINIMIGFSKNSINISATK